jgi:prepilin-type N-terminal cleavage/methylation domain-containing protein
MIPCPAVSVSTSRSPVRVGPRRSGFTLLEMLVTIGILLVLMGIIVVGLNVILGNNQRKQTEAILKRAQAFAAEVNNSKQGRDSFYQRVLWTTYIGAPNVNSAAVPVAAGSAASVDNSVVIVRYLLSLKPNRDAAQKLPPRTATDIPSSYRNGFTGADAQLLANVMMDAWGNPIVFVPDALEVANASTGLGQPASGAGGLSGLKSTSGAVNSTRFTAPDRRPFWFSAGPDGKYETHDDNVYSFN